MSIRVGINGFGRIGRNFFRAQQQRGADIEIVAAQRPRRCEDDGPPAEVRLDAWAVRRRGRRSATASSAQAVRRCKMLSEQDPAALPWGDLGVDVVLESTGFFTDARRRAEASRRWREEGHHLGAGDRPRPHRRARRQRRRLRPRRASRRLECLLHDELRRAAREGPRRRSPGSRAAS